MNLTWYEPGMCNHVYYLTYDEYDCYSNGSRDDY